MIYSHVQCLLILTVFAASTRSTNKNNSELQFVIVVTRHGSRSPLHHFKNDPYQGAQYWPEGKGVLTSLGKLQAYQRGQALRERYGDFLNEGTYKEEDVYVKSTPLARTYMSCAALLAGMFPPIGEQIWNPDLNWQPIPIWPDTYDKTQIVSSNRFCPLFSRDQARGFARSDFFARNKELLDFLEKYSGLTVVKPTDFLRIWDPLNCEFTHNLKLPDWTKSVYPEKMRSVAAQVFKLMISNTTTMTRLVSGELIKDFNSWMLRKLSGAATQKLLLHSGHDVTIVSLLNMIGHYEEELMVVQPAATILIELHRSTEGPRVEMYYYKDTSIATPIQLLMPECPHPCSLDDFFKMTKKFEMTDWNVECRG